MKLLINLLKLTRGQYQIKGDIEGKIVLIPKGHKEFSSSKISQESKEIIFKRLKNYQENEANDLLSNKELEDLLNEKE